MIAGYAWLNLRAEGNVVLDKASGCPIAGPNSVTAVLFDASDPIPTSTQADVANKFRNIAEGIPQGGYLWVGVLTPQPGELRVLFSHCNPGDGASVDAWTSNPARHQKVWEEAFAEPLKNLPSELPASETANTSPVMAGIQQLKLQVFDSGLYDRVPKHLVVISDMLENTGDYSQYSSGPNYSAFRKSPAASRYRTDLLGADVTILYVDRLKNFSSLDHAKFWTEWITENGGTLNSFVKLEGM